MAPSMAASSRAPSSNSGFLYLILFLFYFITSNTLCLFVYDRQTLLDIRAGLSYRFPKFKFWNTDPPFTNPPFISSETPLSWIPGTCKRPGLDLEFLMLMCRPFWLPREFSAVIITAVYIPPQADTDRAHGELYSAISSQETAHPEAVFITTGDFNKANLRKVLPKLHQHIQFNTRGERLLDHCYTSFRNAYKETLPLPLLTHWNINTPPINFGRLLSLRNVSTGTKWNNNLMILEECGRD